MLQKQRTSLNKTENFVCVYAREGESGGRRGRKLKFEELFDTVRNTPSFSLNNFFETTR